MSLPATADQWMADVDGSLRAKHRAGVDSFVLVDFEALRRAALLASSVLSRLEPADIVIAEHLSTLTPATRKAYRRSLAWLARRVGSSSARATFFGMLQDRRRCDAHLVSAMEGAELAPAALRTYGRC